MSRTSAQIEADRLDMEMNRLANQIDSFADDFGGRDKSHLRRAADSIQRSRYAVREYMCVSDIEATS